MEFEGVLSRGQRAVEVHLADWVLHVHRNFDYQWKRPEDADPFDCIHVEQQCRDSTEPRHRAADRPAMIWTTSISNRIIVKKHVIDKFLIFSPNSSGKVSKLTVYYTTAIS